MKKLLLLSALSFASLTIFAQDKTSGFELSVGAEGGLPVGDFNTGYNIGFGATGKLAYNFDASSAATFQTGYMSFGGKTVSAYGYSASVPAVGFVPFKVGYRYTLDGGIFLEPQLGFTAVSNGGGTAFTYAFNAGYRMTPGLDISARYEGVSKSGSTLSFIGLRVAYSFSLSGN
jgi:hypothetical protein